MSDDRPFVEKFKDWTLEPSDVWYGALNLVHYYTQLYGFWGWVGVIGVVIFILLSLDITRGITSQVIGGTYRGIILFVLAAVGFLLAGIARISSATLVARWRDAVRFWSARFRGSPNSP